MRVCVCLGVCVCVCFANQPSFSSSAHVHTEVGRGMEGKIRLGKSARFLWQSFMRGMSSTCT